MAERSWEWIDDSCFVCRERQLSKDGRRLSSREVVTVTNRGVIRDQFYQERLYSREEVSAMLYSAGFDVIVDESATVSGKEPITTAKDMSKRKEDLGMMEQRMFIKGIKPAVSCVVVNGIGRVSAPSSMQELTVVNQPDICKEENCLSLSSSDSSPASSPPSPLPGLDDASTVLSLNADSNNAINNSIHLPIFPANVAVILGDVSIPCVGKLNDTWNPEDLETRSKLIQALEELGYSILVNEQENAAGGENGTSSIASNNGIRVLERHAGLMSDLEGSRPSFVFNLCTC